MPSQCRRFWSSLGGNLIEQGKNLQNIGLSTQSWNASHLMTSTTQTDLMTKEWRQKVVLHEAIRFAWFGQGICDNF